MAKPDGYTIAIASTAQLVFNIYLFDTLPYEPVRGLLPVTKLVSGRVAIVANHALPANSVASLVTLARAKPGLIEYAVPQLGAPPHLFALMILRAAGIEMLAVPYRSGPEALRAVLRGDVQVLLDAPAIVAPHVRSGELKALGVIGRTRDPLLPDTPTLIESGFSDLDPEAWLGLVVPAGVPSAVVETIHNAVARVLRSRKLAQHFEELGFEINGDGPEAFAGSLRADRVKWERVIRDANLRLK